LGTPYEKHRDAHFHDEPSIAILAKFSENGKSPAVQDTPHSYFLLMRLKAKTVEKYG